MIIRWICEKDNKKWLYPVKKCLYCKGPIKKQVSRKAKVIGITKVNVPSPFHPITPYNVILLEDEFGNRMPKKTMKDYKIGDIYSIKTAKTDSAVIITKIKYDLGIALEESLDLLKSFDIKKGDKVLIKPCVIQPAYPYQAVNTNPDLLNEVIKLLKDKGISDMVVGEQAMLGDDVEAAAKKSGILDVCMKNKVQVLDLGKSEYIEKNENGIKFNIAKEVLERKIINLPVMKTNSQLGISGAIENMVRVVDKKTQIEMFAGDIEKTLPKLIKTLPRFLSIGDATLGMQGQGPTSLGEPAFLNMLFISKDPVALDTVFVEMGLLPAPKYILVSAASGIGNGDVKSIEIIGDELEAITYHLKLPDICASAHPKIKLVDGKSNPMTFNTILKLSSKLVGLSGYEVNVAIGKFLTKDMLIGKERIIAYGDDAITKLREFDVKPIAEISEDMDQTEKLMLLKSILDNRDKKRLNSKDKVKSKFASIGVKIKDAF
ncbi:MAG: DUF362 domain-containing protein [Candidatus Woesearchaeota archaeon]|jgi:uncharacterized protein (DUF362 family)|nr:DUF362 domain-containing protein [Candidatus Woesearchaeota archaeon]|tara:strand:+ start:559 stop:2025 length:1467 start_codon:yes stop_codon:yes gene_type:complete